MFVKIKEFCKWLMANIKPWRFVLDVLIVIGVYIFLLAIRIITMYVQKDEDYDMDFENYTFMVPSKCSFCGKPFPQMVISHFDRVSTICPECAKNAYEHFCNVDRLFGSIDDPCGSKDVIKGIIKTPEHFYDVDNLFGSMDEPCDNDGEVGGIIKPSELYANLDEYIIGQENAKKV